MLRLPPFSYKAPTDVSEAARILAGEGPAGMLVAGGTDVYPKMKRRQFTPKTLIALSGIAAINNVTGDPASGMVLGGGVTLTQITRNETLRAAYPAIVEAAEVISTPQLRNMGTIGGNLCVDTRCTYYDQTYHWRKSISFCMKKEGEICWVAPGSPRCWAVTSSDLAPVMLALGAKLKLVGPDGERLIDAVHLWQDDGISFLTKRPDELLTEIHLPPASNWQSTYIKLRRRGAFDFPVLGTAVAIRRDNGTIAEAKIAISGVGSQPVELVAAGELLAGKAPEASVFEQVAQMALKKAKALDNTDLVPLYRKRMVPVFVKRALEKLTPG